VLGLVVVVTPALHGQTVPEDAIAAAIQAGLSKKQSGSLIVSGFSSMFTLVVDGPLTRVQAKASTAAKEYRTFTRADVTADLLEPVVTITAVPDDPVFNRFSGWTLTPLATRIVLQPKAKGAAAIQPTKVETFPMSWGNAMGGQFQGQGVTASFPIGLIPPEDFEAIVITDGREYRMTIKAKDRSKIR